MATAPRRTRRIALLTSGDDCAGLNAIIRAVVLRAGQLDWEVTGMLYGTDGLLGDDPQTVSLRPEHTDTVMMRQGGTVLGTTNKGDPFAYVMPDGSVKDRSGDIIENFRKTGCDGLIGIGGVGSLPILLRLSEQGGIPLICVPKTIDNDVCMTETAVGFNTAVAVATEALDRLQPTAASHDRIMVLEVMGRGAGHIALAAGIAGGADVILLPEIPYDIDIVADHLQKVHKPGHNFGLVVVCEAARPKGGTVRTHVMQDGQVRLGGVGQVIGAQIGELCQAETRVTVLGHVLRGGQPSAWDRLTAAAFGVRAVELLNAGQSGRMVAWSQRGVTDVLIADVINKGSHPIEADDSLVRVARGLGICLGDQPAEST